jgi:hypothetical protein
VASQTKNGAASLTITRLAIYLNALGKVGNVDEVSVGDFLQAADHLTHSELVADLQTLGLPVSDTIRRHQLARAIRKESKQARARFDAVSFSKFEVPSVESLLNDMASPAEAETFRRGELIEIAHEFAMQKADYHLLGHGLLHNEPPPEHSDSGEDQSLTPRAPVEAVALKHQIVQARLIVQQKLACAIVVHEVGLGKTLTAILVLCELLLRDRALRSLILVPPNLRDQWKRELSRCPDLKVYSGRTPGELDRQQHVLMSIDNAKKEPWQTPLHRQRWDLLVVDEGHLLRNDDTVRYRFAYALRARHRLLLTATPVQNSAYDIYQLTNVVRPGMFGKKSVFAEDYMQDERQVTDPQAMRDALAKVVNRVRRDETGINFPQREIVHVLVRDRSQAESDLYDEVLGILRGIYRRNLGAAAYVSRPSGKQQAVATLVLVAIQILRQMASHPTAALKTLSSALVRSLKAANNTDDLQALERILKRHAHVDWKKEGAHSKTDRLINEIPGLVKKHGRVIVYVEFRETQKTIVERLEGKHGKVGLPAKTAVISFHGGLTEIQKDNQRVRFNQSPKACFVSTDAGGQGLNLQAGHTVLNFDFPWNPMRVEQRIGRVDRLGQAASKVLIRNFITTGTIEQYVYNTLRRKLRVCDDVLGHLIPRIFTLSGVHEKYLSDEDVLGIGQIILSSENEKDLRQKFNELDEEIDQRIQSKQSVWQPTRRWLE